MSERDAWLALTREDAIDPDLPICDPHHHLWDYPESMYMVDEFLADVSNGHKLLKTVYVECRRRYREAGAEEMKPVGETEFIEQAVTTHSGKTETEIAAAIVGFAELTLGEEVQLVLEAHKQASERFRGIRYMSAWDENEKIHNSPTNPEKDTLYSSEFRAGFACLAKLDLTFDAWMYFHQLPDLVDLANAFPDTPIVLNHAGGAIGIGPYAGKREEVFTQWSQHMTGLARCENVYVKLGGMTMSMSGFGWHKKDRPPPSTEIAESLKPYFTYCIEQFGVERCMFESNFPVDKVSCSYTLLWNAFKHVSADYSEDERRALFHDTASRFYRLNVSDQ